jgi:uncharacterized protein YgbK (DUF1537 family)
MILPVLLRLRAFVCGISLAFCLELIHGPKAQIKIVATNSRSETEEQAMLIHKRITHALVQENPEFIFKKCDSVLRGHVLAELTALMSVTGHASVVLQPSNPASERIIRNGNYYIGSIPLHETPFATDPDFPARSSYIDDLLYRNQRILSFEYRVSDCISVEQLREIAISVTDNKIAAGSSAFFEQILLQLTSYQRINCKMMRIVLTADTLLVNGSVHNSSTDFAKMIEDQMFVKVFGALEQLEPAWFFEEIQQLIQLNKISQILVTGGATAWYFLKCLGIDQLVPEMEYAPGVVGMRTPYSNGVSIIMKPGSYSWPINIE